MTNKQCVLTVYQAATASGSNYDLELFVSSKQKEGSNGLSWQMSKTDTSLSFHLQQLDIEF